MTEKDFPKTDPPTEPGDMHSEPTPPPPAAAPPRRGGSRPRRTPGSSQGEPKPPPARSPGSGRPTGGSARDLKGRLEELFAGMALVPMTMGDTYSAQIIATRSGHLAEAWADLAKQNPAVRRVLEGLLQGGAWGGVVVATGSIVVPILGHYGVLPPIDPWAMVYGAPNVTQGERRRPIVPPVPGGAGGAHPHPRRDGAGTPATNGEGSMTPPIADDQPPGVVTVAGSGNRAAQVPGA